MTVKLKEKLNKNTAIYIEWGSERGSKALTGQRVTL